MKPRLVLLHGWAVNSRIWNPILDQLRARYEVTVLDLPGYSSQIDYNGDYDIDSVVKDVLSRAPQRANWAAWSLGGTVAMAAAIAQPERFQCLQLISTTPCFLTKQDWVHGVAAEPFEKLAAGFEASYPKALKRFLLLQTFSEDPEQKKKSLALVRELTDLLSQTNPPSGPTLQAGLELLRQTDLRQRLGELRVKTQVVGGETDRVVPIEASKHLFEKLTNSHSFKSLPGGHLPFLQTSSDYIGCLEKFIPPDNVGES